MNALMIDWVGTLLLLGILARLSYVDWRTFRLPNLLTKPLILLGLIYNLNLSLDFYPYLLGAILGYAIFWTVETGYRLIRESDLFRLAALYNRNGLQTLPALRRKGHNSRLRKPATTCHGLPLAQTQRDRIPVSIHIVHGREFSLRD